MKKIALQEVAQPAERKSWPNRPSAAAPRSAVPFPPDARNGTECDHLGSLDTQRIYQGNFLEMAAQLPDQSVDLIIADPPYNATKGILWSMEYGTLPGFGGDWKKIAQVWDDMSLDEYLAFTLSWLSEAKRVLKQTGSMWVHGTYHSAGITNVAMQMFRIEIINEIVWYKLE